MAYTVLIAEDDGDIVNILKLYLESSGYRVLTAPDGESAYRLIETEEIHLAIFDIMMPKMIHLHQYLNSGFSAQYSTYLLNGTLILTIVGFLFQRTAK